MQRLVVQATDASEVDERQILHIAPRSLGIDQFGFAEAVYRRAEGVDLYVADASNRCFKYSFGQMPGTANGQIVALNFPVIDQTAFPKKGHQSPRSYSRKVSIHFKWQTARIWGTSGRIRR